MFGWLFSKMLIELAIGKPDVALSSESRLVPQYLAASGGLSTVNTLLSHARPMRE